MCKTNKQKTVKYHREKLKTSHKKARYTIFMNSLLLRCQLPPRLTIDPMQCHLKP